MNDSVTEAPMPGKTPPYVPFRTFLTLLEDFKEHGIPPQIDASVLKRFSGSAGSQLASALKSLGYVDDQRKCLPSLKKAVDTYKTENFPGHLNEILAASYPFLNALDLQTATPSMFADAFRKALGAKEDVLRKCRTFYLQAAQQAGVEIGPRLKAGAATVSTNGVSSRRRFKSKSKPSEALGVGSAGIPGDGVRHTDDQTGQHQHGKALEYQLIDLMSEPDIDDVVKQSIWSLVQYLMARKAKVVKEPAAG